MEKVWLNSYEPTVPQGIGELKYQNLSEYAESCFKKYHGNIAYTNLGRDMTYGELAKLTKYFANYLRNGLGLKKNDRIAIMMPNVIQYPIALFAALQAGLVVVNVNPLYTATELQFQLEDSGAEVLIVMSNFIDTVAKVCHHYPLKKIIVTDLGDMLGAVKGYCINFMLKYVMRMVPHLSIDGVVKFSQALVEGKAMGKHVEMPTVYSSDIAFLQYTGGTTGVSKAAILSHHNLLSNIEQSSLWIASKAVENKEIVVTPLPLYHIFSLTVNCLIFLGLGAQNILITNPKDIKRFIKTLKKYKFTAITCVNTLFNALADTPEFSQLDFSKLKVALGGGMSVQGSVAEKWQKITKKPLLEAYGLTETSPGATINPMYVDGYNGTVGLPLPSTDIKLCDDDGNEMPKGEPGELWIKGPQVMQGYWNRPNETEKVLVDGWLKTGDIAEVNEKGFVTIVDRKKDMILVSGFNVYPNQVEEVLITCPGVKEVGVIGEEEKETKKEIVVAYIVKSDNTLSVDSIKDYARDHLTAYKVPKKILFIDELPKTNVGKISRKDLKLIHKDKKDLSA